MTERVIKLTVEYDGAPFAGWQVQPNQRTVQGALESALAVVLREPVSVQGSGRTDAGVHAWAQIASFRTVSDVTPERVRRGVNALAGPGVRVVAAEEAPADFDARHSARGKVYAYQVLVRRSPSPLLEGRAWWIRHRLDLELLGTELASLPGTADWSAYRAADCGAPSAIKTLHAATVRPGPHDTVNLVFTGSGFLKQMVRILAGTAIEVARGQLAPGSMLRIRDGGRREHAGPTAPPWGLYLERVLYEPYPPG